MNDTISRQSTADALKKIQESLEKILSSDSMKREYAQGMTCGVALAIEYVEQLATPVQ